MLKNGAWFPYLIIGLLLLSVGSNVYLLVRATNDPSFAVEPDYYEKAVHWDDHQAARAASDKLGWKIRVDARREMLRIELRDALGRPIDGAEVEVIAFHNARAAERINGLMLPRGRGVYVLERPFARAGIWEYRLAAVLEDKTFLHVTKEELQ